MPKLEIAKNMFLYLLLPSAGIAIVAYCIYHFFGNTALGFTVLVFYALLAWRSHRSKQQQLKEIEKKSTEPASSYELACLVMKSHQVSPDSYEVTKLISKLVTRLKYEESGKVPK